LPVARYWAEYAWLGGRPHGGGAAAGVLIEVEAGRFGAVTAGTTRAPTGAVVLPGLTMPGLANAHSHAFHRALRGRTQTGTGTFWTWRERMYALAGRLTPDSYHALARATFAEMALAGISAVGEFHYLHHGPDGVPYADPNEMGHRLIEAAGQAGLRITLLDTLYLTSTVDGTALDGVQRRFGDAGTDAWLDRVRRIEATAHSRVGLAVHSVRAVPESALAALGAADLTSTHRPLHVHLSEQVAENQACLARYGRTPTQLLDDTGLLGPATTAVHATHLSDVDRTALGDSGTGACFCPTTERDLADGIGPARALLDAGAPLSLGSDSHAVIDLLEEARAVELDERLRSGQRGHFTVDELLDAATRAGHAALGWTDAGTIEVGGRADLVTVALDSVRTAGYDPAAPAHAVLFGATAADVTHVLVDGRVVVADRRHQLVADPAARLRDAIRTVWR
jgi:formiminoglutamate deiminase